MACYANQELYDIMTTASDTMTACHDNPGQYPNGKTAGPAFCLFDQLGFVSSSNSIAIFLNQIQIFRYYFYLHIKYNLTDEQVQIWFHFCPLN